MHIQIEIVAAALGIFAALVIIARLKHAEARVRSLRLEVMDRKTTVRAADLNAILLAENAKLVAKGIDQGSLIMQGSHKVISEVTFGLLQLFPVTREHAKIVRETHNMISEGLYGAFREVSKHVGGNIAAKLKEGKPKKRRVALVRKRVKAKKKS